MNKLKKIVKSPAFIIALFVVAAALITLTTINGARAALVYSAEYRSQMDLYDIGVSLDENGVMVAHRDYIQNSDGEWDETPGIWGPLLQNLIPAGETFKVGKGYTEELTVTNSGTIDEYVRVNIYRYWKKADGSKEQTLSPELINLNYINQGTYWIYDADSSTEEKAVFYYNRILGAGETTVPLTDLLWIDNSIAKTVTQSVSEEVHNGETVTVIRNSYTYNGISFYLEAECDAVQTHNPVHAIKSAWGVDVSVAGDGSLTLLK